MTDEHNSETHATDTGEVFEEDEEVGGVSIFYNDKILRRIRGNYNGF